MVQGSGEVGDKSALETVEDRLAETPCYASGPDERVIFPDRKAPDALRAKWLASTGLTREMRDNENRRAELLDGLRRFVTAVRSVAGVRGISLVGSIVTAKPDPKDIDVLVVVSDDADLAALAVHARRLQGHAQTFNRGADVFLADELGHYIGRTCRWRDCRPGVRQSCDARHCGRRPHLHDDLDAMALSEALIAAPPITLWPAVKRRSQVPPDLEEIVAALEHAV